MPNDADGENVEVNRLQVLAQLEDWLETPMLVLSFIWLVLLVVELIWGLSPLFAVMVNVIWGIFILDFLLRFSLAPDKLRFLRGNVLTAVSLLLPALRMFRIVRVLRLTRAARGLRLVRVVSSLNRGMRATGATLGRRGFGYVMAVTVLTIIVGAAGMLAFESVGQTGTGQGFRNYGDALWWTTMLMTSLGSDYWPQTPEGRVLCILLSLYGFAVFGYVTATFASLFIDQDAASDAGEVASAKSIKTLEAEIRALRADLRRSQGS